MHSASIGDARPMLMQSSRTQASKDLLHCTFSVSKAQCCLNSSCRIIAFSESKRSSETYHRWLIQQGRVAKRPYRVILKHNDVPPREASIECSGHCQWCPCCIIVVVGNEYTAVRQSYRVNLHETSTFQVTSLPMSLDQE